MVNETKVTTKRAFIVDLSALGTKKERKKIIKEPFFSQRLPTET